MLRPLARLLAVVVLGLAVAATTAPVRAGDTGPVFVVPSRPGIPIVIDGRDASYAVVEGDWGLARPGHMAVTIIGGSPLLPSSAYTRRNSYHPRYGRAPERGRNEIEPAPDRTLPEPPESYSRSWSTGPQPVSHAPAHGQQRGSAPDVNSGNDSLPATITDPETFRNDFEASGFERSRRRRR